MKKTLVFLALLPLFSGCASIQKMYDDRNLLMNPVRINESTKEGSAAAGAFNAIVSIYYQAFRAAQTDYSVSPAKKAEPIVIQDYVEAGIALTNLYCRNWFHRVSDKERGLGLSTQNINVIRDLGTVALGLGGASSAVVTGYGALNTAYSGLQENFSSALLTAPAQRRVQVKILEMLDSAAWVLRADALEYTFLKAFDRLSGYADICTFATVQDAINDAISATETSVHPASGKLLTLPRGAEH